MGVSISKRQLQRLLTDKKDDFVTEAQDVLRAGLETSRWVSVDDTGARHAGKNGFCTQIGNDWFTWFGTRSSKSRLNFLDLLRAGHTDYALDDAAYAYMRDHGLPAALIARLAARPETRFADQAAWLGHLDRLGFSALAVTPDPVRIATEGALWGQHPAHQFLCDAVVVSDDAGQFVIGRHALCWVHAERLVHKLDTFTDQHRAARHWFAPDLDFYGPISRSTRSTPVSVRLARCVPGSTVSSAGARASPPWTACWHGCMPTRPNCLMVLDRPEIPLHTNGSENDIRCQVTRRKVSAGDTQRDRPAIAATHSSVSGRPVTNSASQFGITSEAGSEWPEHIIVQRSTITSGDEPGSPDRRHRPHFCPCYPIST